MNGWKPSSIFVKSSILDVCQGFKYASAVHNQEYINQKKIVG